MKLICLFGHKWQGCKCVNCGEKRSEHHEYIYSAVRQMGKSLCEERCRICGKKEVREHFYQPSGTPCVLSCKRCGCRTEKHDFKPVQGRCADICAGCGRELDYMKIAVDRNAPYKSRCAAVERLKAESVLPDVFIKDCAEGRHMLMRTGGVSQQFRGDTSYNVYECVICGYKETIFDYGD